MNEIWIAGFWGLFAGGALLIGAAVGYFMRVPRRLTAAVMAFGSGVLLSALSFELMLEAVRSGGFTAAAGGFLLGAGIYTIANWALSRAGAKHRKRSGEQHPAADTTGAAIAVGSLLDGIRPGLPGRVRHIHAVSRTVTSTGGFILRDLEHGDRGGTECCVC